MRTRGAGGVDKARSDPSGRTVPHPGEETTNHSKGKPESEWSISSIPCGEAAEGALRAQALRARVCTQCKAKATYMIDQVSLH